MIAAVSPSKSGSRAAQHDAQDVGDVVRAEAVVEQAHRRRRRVVRCDHDLVPVRAQVPPVADQPAVGRVGGDEPHHRAVAERMVEVVGERRDDRLGRTGRPRAGDPAVRRAQVGARDPVLRRQSPRADRGEDGGGIERERAHRRARAWWRRFRHEPRRRSGASGRRARPSPRPSRRSRPRADPAGADAARRRRSRVPRARPDAGARSRSAPRGWAPRRRARSRTAAHLRVTSGPRKASGTVAGEDAPVDGHPTALPGTAVTTGVDAAGRHHVGRPAVTEPRGDRLAQARPAADRTEPAPRSPTHRHKNLPMQKARRTSAGAPTRARTTTNSEARRLPGVGEDTRSRYRLGLSFRPASCFPGLPSMRLPPPPPLPSSSVARADPVGRGPAVPRRDARARLRRGPGAAGLLAAARVAPAHLARAGAPIGGRN